MLTTTYSPVIKQATLKQRIPGVRVFLIQSERDPNTFYFAGIYPDGYVRCQCPAGKLGRTCKHKLLLVGWIEAAQRVEPMLADMTTKELVEAFNRRRTRNSLPLLPVATKVTVATVPQMTFACSRTGYGKETTPLADNSYAGSIFR